MQQAVNTAPIIIKVVVIILTSSTLSAERSMSCPYHRTPAIRANAYEKTNLFPIKAESVSEAVHG
jgi:hypothetical protein